MNEANELHARAMSRVDQALMAKSRGDRGSYHQNLREAFRLERDAAQLVAKTDLEPSRSVLLRSAAALAVDCGEIEEARRLAELGLQGAPPPEIEAELRETLRKAEESALLKELYPVIRRFFLNSNYSIADTSRLARLTLLYVYRQIQEASMSDVMEAACRAAFRERRTRRKRAEIHEVTAADFQSRIVPAVEPLRRALTELTDKSRRCFLMRIEKVPNSAIARALCVSIETVDSLWEEALRHLSNQLVPGFEVPTAIQQTTQEPMIGGTSRQRG